ncbi:MAG: hypothetical protein V5A62_11400 [Haloarculaceae archaeon]
MPERLFRTLERTDLIVHTYDADLPRTSMGRDTAPRPGSTVQFDTGATVTFQRSVVRRGEAGPDVHLFAIEDGAAGDGDVIGKWPTETRQDDPFARVETPDGFVDLERDDLETTLEEPLLTDQPTQRLSTRRTR